MTFNYTVQERDASTWTKCTQEVVKSYLLVEHRDLREQGRGGNRGRGKSPDLKLVLPPWGRLLQQKASLQGKRGLMWSLGNKKRSRGSFQPSECVPHAVV